VTEWIVQIRGETEQTDFTQSVGRIVFGFLPKWIVPESSLDFLLLMGLTTGHIA
jgi:hypothetical protein